MTLFWMLIGILILIAVTVIIWPLLPFNIKKLTSVKLGRSSKNVEIFKQRLAELEEEGKQGKLSADELKQIKLELEQAMLVDVIDERIESVHISTGSWFGAGILCLLLIGTSLGLYSRFYHNEGLAVYLARNKSSSQQTKPELVQQHSRMSLAEEVVGLEEKLAGNPDDKQGWSLLAMTYRQLGSFRKSADAFKHLVDLIEKDDPQYAAMLGSYAQSLYIAEGEKITLDVQKVIDEALQIDPLEPSVLSLVGAKLFAQSDFQGAIKQWKKALQKADKVQAEQYLQPAIVAAVERLGMSANVQQSVAVTETEDVAIKVHVDER